MGIMKGFDPRKRERKRHPRQGERRAYKPRGRFITVEGTESPVWDMLSRAAVWVLIQFYKKFNGYNRSNLSLTYGEVRGKIANGTFNKAIWELIGFGFIDRIREGRLERNASIYGLSNRWKELEKRERKHHRIKKLIARADKVHRIKTPSNLSPEDKIGFQSKRRQIRRAILKKVAEGGGYGNRSK